MRKNKETCHWCKREKAKQGLVPIKFGYACKSMKECNKALTERVLSGEQPMPYKKPRTFDMGEEMQRLHYDAIEYNRLKEEGKIK